MFHSRPVHSLMLSSHRFLCLSLDLPPWTVPCRIVLACPNDLVTYLYYFSLCLFTDVRRSSCLHTAQWRFQFWLSLPRWLCDLCTRYWGVAEASHLQFFQCLLLCGPCFTCIQKYGHGQGTHQSDVGADGDVLVVLNDFQFGHWNCGLDYPGPVVRTAE